MGILVGLSSFTHGVWVNSAWCQNWIVGDSFGAGELMSKTQCVWCQENTTDQARGSRGGSRETAGVETPGCQGA